jgi:hypothetical protein
MWRAGCIKVRARIEITLPQITTGGHWILSHPRSCVRCGFAGLYAIYSVCPKVDKFIAAGIGLLMTKYKSICTSKTMQIAKLLGVKEGANNEVKLAVWHRR